MYLVPDSASPTVLTLAASDSSRPLSVCLLVQSAYLAMQEGGGKVDDFLETLVDMREYDVPYVIRVAIDKDLRVGAWYRAVPGPEGVELEWLKDMIQKVRCQPIRRRRKGQLDTTRGHVFAESIGTKDAEVKEDTEWGAVSHGCI